MLKLFCSPGPQGRRWFDCCPFVEKNSTGSTRGRFVFNPRKTRSVQQLEPGEQFTLSMVGNCSKSAKNANLYIGADLGARLPAAQTASW